MQHLYVTSLFHTPRAHFLLTITDSTALLIGEKCAMLTAEDLGYSGKALEMKVPNYHAPGELSGLASARL
tara:strand:+ start:195 stop:404 length:210 start_codon:yes stop_codon:yes gene_type:complete